MFLITNLLYYFLNIFLFVLCYIVLYFMLYFQHNKAKVEILKKDLDFFTQQRRMVRKFVCNPQKTLNDCFKEGNNLEINDKPNQPEEEIIKKLVRFYTSYLILYSERDEDADEAEFIRRFHDLLDYGPHAIGKCQSG